MKFIIGTLLASGSFVAGDMPSPGANECAIVSTDIQHAAATLIDPTPAAESLRIVVYCGHAVTTDTGGTRTERALKVIDVDLEQAEVLLQAAADLLVDGDVYIGG